MGCRGKCKGYQAQSREIEVMRTKYGTIIHALSTLFSIFNSLEGLSTLIFVAAYYSPSMDVYA
jgi:hypothetical protein